MGGTFFTVNSTANKFTIIGCDAYGYFFGDRLNHTYKSQTGCMAMCGALDDMVEGNCTVIDWAIGYETCEEARLDASSYACKAVNATCLNKHSNGYGYRCYCQEGYQGNPYLTNGCQDVNECEDQNLNDCMDKYCVNTPGSFNCTCPEGYHGDGKKDGKGKGCIPDDQSLVYKLAKATDNFNNNRIIGKGGFGTVYKGSLGNKITVAIKKPIAVDTEQKEQFINELMHVHNKAKASSLSWDMRLKIASETAGVLWYLHSSASTPIIHRDVKSANILLDGTHTAKVSDFGSSKLVPWDQTHVATMVQGTLGYLDPEYMQTNQLTEKSDVYSFGVVLIELLTGKMVLRCDGPEEERSLAKLFLSVMKQNRLFEILDDNVASEENKERVMKVAELARSCLNVKGDDRPSMKEVAMELEGLRVGVKHSWVQSENNAEDMDFSIGDGFSSITNSYGLSIGFDSLNDATTLPVDGGR
ncbi:wall-associated receptor kinase 4 [Phtheirospermum japonicum]|uniref:Wall-associated receptor kinase 4 n=1 Tax=Phtheirospermum japonicum TaxID=374723 RepID=A0A830B690_9LAMI|nr:wall-associated receptor kinase 4 [Phtheirospermum japonicum]